MLLLSLIVISLQPLIIVVEENETVLSDTPDNLGIEAVSIHVSFYFLNPPLKLTVFDLVMNYLAFNSLDLLSIVTIHHKPHFTFWRH